jgi:hypothetical protein
MNELIAIQKIAGWKKLKTLVLDSVSSPITKRVYNTALDEFMAWFQHGSYPCPSKSDDTFGFSRNLGFCQKNVSEPFVNGFSLRAQDDNVAVTGTPNLESALPATHSSARFGGHQK